MKKAKIILGAVGLLSVVGGSLAFKAQHRLGKWVCRTTTITSSLCSIPATTSGVPTTILPCTFTTVPKTCTNTYFVSINQ